MIEDVDGKIDEALTEIWQRHLPVLRERLEILDRAAAEASCGTLGETLELEALSVAHKLAGNLGMFGYDEGSRIASEMEQVLRAPAGPGRADLAGLSRDLRRSLATAL